MGVVYAARDDELDRSLAIKGIAEELADETAMRRFRRVARAADEGTPLSKMLGILPIGIQWPHTCRGGSR